RGQQSPALATRTPFRRHGARQNQLPYEPSPRRRDVRPAASGDIDIRSPRHFFALFVRPRQIRSLAARSPVPRPVLARLITRPTPTAPSSIVVRRHAPYPLPPESHRPFSISRPPAVSLC